MGAHLTSTSHVGMMWEASCTCGWHDSAHTKKEIRELAWNHWAMNPVG